MNIVSVSYTHLDVYKRQIMDKVKLTPFALTLGLCKLNSAYNKFPPAKLVVFT